VDELINERFIVLQLKQCRAARGGLKHVAGVAVEVELTDDQHLA
jgi:hypothetical protein